VTRHPALVAYLFEHATPEALKGKHVWGVLPLYLAGEPETYTVIRQPRPYATFLAEQAALGWG